MKAAVFITVRMKSTRLPRKALLEIKGKPTIGHLIERMKKASLPSMIILCTSTHTDDAVLCDVAKKFNVVCFRGSPEDKLDRYLRCAEKFGIDFIVNADGDDILCSWEYVDKIIENFNRTNADVFFCRGLPLGVAPSGMKVSALKKVCEMKDENDTEVWGGYFTKPGLFHIDYLDASHDEKSDARMTLDYPEDFEFFRHVIESMGEEDIFSLRKVIRFINSHPETKKINEGAQKKYEEYIKKSAPIKFKKTFS